MSAEHYLKIKSTNFVLCFNFNMKHRTEINYDHDMTLHVLQNIYILIT